MYAFLNVRDTRHEEAKALIARISSKEFGIPFVTDHVVDELFVLIRKRTGSPVLEEAARQFFPLPEPSLPGLGILSLGIAGLQPTYEIFRKYRDQGISFTDASLLATMREYSISTLATFDSSLANLAPAPS